jgi:hypothetical protein
MGRQTETKDGTIKESIRERNKEETQNNGRCK